MLKQCKYWRFYKGLKEPTCGCETCLKKWEYMSRRRAKASYTEDCPDPSECEEGCVGYCSEVEDLTEDCVSFIKRNI